MTSTKDRPQARAGDPYWIIHQDQEVTVLRQRNMPSVEVAKGERIKRLMGPIYSEEDAKKMADGIRSRTMTAIMQRGGN